jgi:hypothetical protein
VNDVFIPLDSQDAIKLLQILTKFKSVQLIEFIVEYYSLSWILNSSLLDPLDWEEWINIQFSIKIKLSIDAPGGLYRSCLKDYEACISKGLQVDKILAKATRVGDLNNFFMVLKDLKKYEIIHNLLLKLTMFEQEVFLSKYLEYLSEDVDLFKGCDYLAKIVLSKNKALVMVLENRLFLKFRDYKTNHLLVHALSANQELLSGFAKSLLNNWGNQGLVDSNSVKSCISYTNLLLLVLEHLQEKYLTMIRLNLISGNIIKS